MNKWFTSVGHLIAALFGAACVIVAPFVVVRAALRIGQDAYAALGAICFGSVIFTLGLWCLARSTGAFYHSGSWRWFSPPIWFANASPERISLAQKAGMGMLWCSAVMILLSLVWGYEVYYLLFHAPNVDGHVVLGPIVSFLAGLGATIEGQYLKKGPMHRYGK